VIHRLFGRCFHRDDRYKGATLRFRPVRNTAVDQGKQRVIAADADVLTHVPLRAALTHDDPAGENALAAKQLDAEALASGVAPVARRTACFFCGPSLKLRIFSKF